MSTNTPMDSRAEFTEPPRRNIVEKDQVFPLFSSAESGISKMPDPYLAKAWDDNTALRLPGLPPIAFESFLSNFNLNSIQSLNKTSLATSFVPFDKNLGYQVTSADQDPAARKAKIDASTPLIDTRTIMEKAPLNFRATIGKTTRGDSSDFDAFIKAIQADKKLFEAVNRLKLQLIFPDITLEGRPLPAVDFQFDPAKRFEALVEEGKLFFESFYPLDVGVLPTAVVGQNVDKGPEEQFEAVHGIQLPNDFEKLKQIKAKFVLADSESMMTDIQKGIDPFMPKHLRTDSD